MEFRLFEYLYYEGLKRQLKLGCKLKYELPYLNNFLKMAVSPAVRLLSSSVAIAFREIREMPATTEDEKRIKELFKDIKKIND